MRQTFTHTRTVSQVMFFYNHECILCLPTCLPLFIMYNLLFTNAPPDNLVCTKFYRHSDKSVQKSEYTFLLFVYLHSGS